MATVCDVANPCVFVAAADLGLEGSELLEGHRDRPGLPLFVIVAPPADYVDANGQTQIAA